ncbi:uncharacterized protein rab44 [Festucalex cinctus]
MPGPSGKRRLGSRRRGPTQVEMPEDLSVADQTSQAQPKEVESLTALSNDSHVPLEIDGIHSSEQKSSRRKLGSKRQSKIHNSEQPPIESYHKPTKEVEQNVHTEEVQAQMIPAGQAVRQEFSEIDYDSMYGTHLYSAYTSGHTLEALNPSYLDSDLERHQPISGNFHLEQDGQSDRKQNIYKQVENTSTHWSVKQQLNDQSEFTAMSVQHTFIDAEKEDMNEDPPQLAEALHFDHLNVKSNEMDFPGNPERPREKSSYSENVEMKNSVEQVDYIPTVAELPSNEEHELFNILQVKSAQIPDQNENEEIKSSESDQIDYHEIATHDDKEPIDRRLENLTDEIVELDQVEQNVKSTTDSSLNPQDKREEQLLKDSQAPDTNEAWIITELTTTPCQEEDVNDQVKVKPEQTQQSNSSHAAETYSESKDDAGKTSDDGGDDATTMKELTSTGEAADMKKIELKEINNLDAFPGEGMHDLVRENAHSNSTVPQLLTQLSNYEEMPEEVEKAEAKAGEENETLSQNENLGDTPEISMPKSTLNEDTEIEYSVAIATISSSKAETSTDEHEHFFSQVRGAQRPDKNLVEEAKSVETDQTKDSEILTDVCARNVAKDIENLVNEILEMHMSDLGMKSIFDSGLNPQDNPEEPHMQEDNIEVLEQRHENNHASDTKEKTNTEKANPTQSQEHDNEAQGISGVEPWNKNLHADFSLSQPLVDAQVSTATPQISTSESRFNTDAEIEYSVAIATISSPKAEASADEQHDHFSFYQVRAAQDPDKDLIYEANSLESDKIEDSVILVHGPTGDVDKNIENLEILETRMPDLSFKSSLDFGLNPQDNLEEHHIVKDSMEDLEQREKNHAFDNTVTWINTRKTDPTQSQDHDNEAQGTSDVDQSAQGILSGMTESELSSQSVQPEENFVFDSQSEDNTPNKDELQDSFSHAMNRRKLGSSRRNKRRQVNVFAAEIYHDFEDAVEKTRDDDSHPGATKEVTFKIGPAEMGKSELNVIDHFDTFQGNDMTGLVRGNAHARFSEVTSNTHSNITETQLLTEQSSSRELSKEEELLIVSKAKAGKENETSPQNENIHADYLVSQPLVGAEVSNAPLEISTSKSSIIKNADIECNLAKATISSARAETSIKEQHEQFSFSQVRDAQFSDFILIKDLKSSEMDQNEDCEIVSPARSRRKLGSSRRHKGTLAKDLAAETYNESTDNPARNSRIEEDLPGQETAEIENTPKNTTNEDVNIQCGPTKAAVSLPKEEMVEQHDHFAISGGYSPQQLENILKQKVYPVEVNELKDIDDSTVKVCSPAGITQVEASLDSESHDESVAEATQHTWNKILSMAAETGQQASQELMKPIFKATEKTEVEVVKSQVIQEEDLISPNYKKDDVASFQVEDPDTLFISHRLTNVYSASLDVQESEEDFQVKNMDAVSLKGEALENVVETEKSALEKAVEEIRDHSDSIDLLNVSLTPPKKRKMGSTRKSHMKGKQEAETDREHDTRALENVPQIETSQTQSIKSSSEEEQKFNTVEADLKLHNSTRKSNMIAATDDVKSIFLEQVASHDAKDANLFTSQVAEVRENDRDTVACIETFEPDYVAVSVPDSKKKQQLPTSTSGIAGEVTEHDVNVIAGQDASELANNEHMDEQSNIQAIKTESDQAPDKNLKSPSLNLTTKKRKMGSSRRNLGTKSKGDLELRLESSNEVPFTTLVQDVMREPAHQSHDKPERSGSEPTNQENTGDPPSTTLAHETGDENLTSEHHPIRLDIMEKTSEERDMLSEFELGGRKRKLGSHRKSKVETNANQSEDDNVTQKLPERTSEKTTHEQEREESQSNTGDTKPSSNISKSVRNETAEEVMASQARQDTWNVSFGKLSDLKAKRYNVVMIGDSNVGKTSFMKRAQNGKFFPDLPASAGLDTCLWTVVVDGKSVALQLWDTAGQERFRSITAQVFHRAHAFLLMYDITSSQSFTAVDYWAKCIQEGAMENVPVLLLGNKSDHADRHVTTEDGQDVAKKFNIDFMECSAVSGDNVIQSLEAVARLLSHKDDRRDETLVLHKEPPKKKAGCC